MNKLQVQQRVLKNGKPLDLDKFEWDEKANTFSTIEDNLVIDFQNLYDCTFKTGDSCTFNTGSDCTFKTGDSCTFDTGCGCTFKTGSYCTFDTGYDCTFKTGKNCVVVRRDVYEVIELEEGKKIKLNSDETKGFVYLDDKVKITYEGKTVEISRESAKALNLI